MWFRVFLAVLGINLIFFLIRFLVRSSPPNDHRYKFKGWGNLKDTDLPNSYTLYKKKYGRSIADPDFDPDADPDANPDDE